MQVTVMHSDRTKSYWFQDGKLKEWNRVNKNKHFGTHQSISEEEVEKFISYIEKRFSNELGSVEVHIITKDRVRVHSWSQDLEEF